MCHLCSVTVCCLQVSKAMLSMLVSIPLYKWLLVLPQLTSRMCHTQKDVQVKNG